jgi:hypothetical protein
MAAARRDAPPGIDASSPRVYGCAGVREQPPHRRLLDDPAGVHDGDAIGHLGDDAEVVRDEQQREPEAVAQLAQQVEDLRLDRHVERGRRLVGDDERGPAGERDGDQRALPHAAGELVRVLARARSGSGMRTASSSSTARRRARPPGEPVHTSAPRPIWSPAVNTGFSAVIGSWKTSRSGAADARISRSPSAQQVAPSKRTRPDAMRPGGCSSRRIDSAVTDLPLPDSPTRPSVSPGDVEADVDDGRDEVGRDLEAGRQVLD